MSDLLPFVSALAGAYEGPLSFDLDGQVTELSTADEISAHDGQLYLQALQADGTVPFVWAMVEEEDASLVDRDALRLPPTAMLVREGKQVLAFWALDVPQPAEALRAIANNFGIPLDEPAPLPGSNDWELFAPTNAETFYTLEEFVAAYGDPPPDDDGEAAEIAPEEAIADADEMVAEEDTPPWDELTYLDAVVKTPFDESDPDLQEVITLSVGASRESRKWKPVEMTVGAAVKLLCTHRVGPKDGMAIVQGDMVPGDRKAVAIKHLDVGALDIDVGVPGEVIDERLKAFGHLAVRYTTHSHMKTRSEFSKDRVVRWMKEHDLDLDDPEAIVRFVRENEKWTAEIAASAVYSGDDHNERGIVALIDHDPIPKHRVFVFFKKPFVIADEGEGQKAAMEKWKLVPKALARALGDLPLDKTGVDPSRLFYLPRHAKGAPFEISLFGGERLDWRTLELTAKLEDALAQAVAGETKHKSKSTTPEGRELGLWMKASGEGFQIADVVRDHAPDRIRAEVSAGLEIECPFDDHHSNPGDTDDRACLAVNAGEGTTNIFTVSCRHESCLDRTAPDMVAKMVKDGWFAKEVLTDETYNAVLSDNINCAEEKQARLELQRQMEQLSKSTDPDTIRNVVALLASIHPDKIECDHTLRTIYESTKKVGLKSLRATYAEYARPAASDDLFPENSPLIQVLSQGRTGPYVPPEGSFGRTRLVTVQGRPWLSGKWEGDVQPLFTPVQLVGGVHFADRDGARALRVDVYNARDEWVSVDLDAGAFASKFATDAVAQLMRAGLAVSSAGREAIVEWLASSQPTGPTVYHRPGLRGDVFVCPTGEVIPADARVELTAEMRLNCAPKAGCLDEWIKGADALFRNKEAYHLQAGVLIGLAGTLTNVAGVDSLAYSAEGKTSSGKSTLSALGCGHWADGKLGRGLFVSAKGTENSQEFPLERGSGTITALDEIGHLPAKAQHDLIFLNQGGVAKRRMTRGNAEQKTRTWTGGALLISAETGFAQRLAVDGVKQTGGLSVRVLPISTDDAPRMSPHEWEPVELMLTNFGWSGPHFVNYLHRQGLFADPQSIRHKVEALIAKLPQTQGLENVQRRRAARNVAFPWAAGEYAAEAGLIPEDFDVAALAARLWTDALASELAPDDPIERAMRDLCDNLIARKGSDIVAYLERDEIHREALGFYGAPTDEGEAYVIRTPKLADLSGGYADGRALRKLLDARGYLICPKDKDSRTWSGFPGLGKSTSYTVLRMSAVECAEVTADRGGGQGGRPNLRVVR